MVMEGNQVPQQFVENAYQYNGKELNSDFGLDWLDYGARWYDASIARWSAVDPLAEIYNEYTPYGYVKNNPIILVDPNGMNDVNSMVNEAWNATPEGSNRSFMVNDGQLGNGCQPFDASNLTVEFSKDKKSVKVSGELIFNVKVLNNSSKKNSESYDRKHEALASSVFDISTLSWSAYVTFDTEGNPITGKTRMNVSNLNITVKLHRIASMNEIGGDNLVLILVDKIAKMPDGKTDPAGVADPAGNIGLIDVNQYMNGNSNLVAHELGHTLFDLDDVYDVNNPHKIVSPTRLMSNGNGKKLIIKEQVEVVASLLYRMNSSKSKNYIKNDTKKDVKELLKKHKI